MATVTSRNPGLYRITQQQKKKKKIQKQSIPVFAGGAVEFGQCSLQRVKAIFVRHKSVGETAKFQVENIPRSA